MLLQIFGLKVPYSYFFNWDNLMDYEKSKKEYLRLGSSWKNWDA